MVAASEVEARISEWLTVFPILAAARKKRAGLLSGGQRQSLAVAMVLMRRPQLLLLDEPVAGMASEAGRELLQAVEALRRREEFPLVIVEHRLRQVQPHVCRVLVMREVTNGQASSLPATMKSMGWIVPVDSATRDSKRASRSRKASVQPGTRVSIPSDARRINQPKPQRAGGPQSLMTCWFSGSKKTTASPPATIRVSGPL